MAETVTLQLPPYLAQSLINKINAAIIIKIIPDGIVKILATKYPSSIFTNWCEIT
ncbi:MAG: hypothetical protein KME29_07830 [Calothrix sp. FI2-JRJ7]|jgi:hypothetical protein|nr:hypothetical protein [Calothrix sp. FI2-JRJ7]